MDRTLKTFGVTIHWKAVVQHFAVVLFVFLFFRVSNFVKCINFGLGTVRRELGVKQFICTSVNINIGCVLLGLFQNINTWSIW